MARRSAWIDPVSLIAMVPVALCSWPTVTSESVTARPVVSTCAVEKSARAAPPAARAASPARDIHDATYLFPYFRIVVLLRGEPCPTLIARRSRLVLGSG